MNDDSDKELIPIIIDLQQLKNSDGQVNELFNVLGMFGTAVEMMLKAMFGNVNIPVRVRGNKSEIDSFMSALSREKRYLDAAKQYGLDDPKVIKNKAKLDSAANKFFSKTGIKWPFK